MEYASTIHSSGNDLLALINEILDLAKIESGTMEVARHRRRRSRTLQDYVERNFREVAQDKGLGLRHRAGGGSAARRSTPTPQRLQQVLRNLLSNAFKFTEQGEVTLRMESATRGLEPGPRGAQPGGPGDRLRRARHRHRHPAAPPAG